MNLEIKKLRANATLPKYAHPGDAGMDVFICEHVTIQPGERVAVPTGFAMKVPEGHVALVWDKSGRALKDGLTVLGGVIDSGYRGEVKVILLNTSEKPVALGSCEKVAQILIQPVISPTLVEVEELDGSARGEGGFGSTGLT
jgi:dUTP pyrophosphatase